MDYSDIQGILYVVATPLGNLKDITFRAVEILKQADLIAAEDTRHSKKLLTHYAISTPVLSCHEHNEQKKIPDLIERLKNGHTIALISDAGTPTISDPGFKLVHAASQNQIKVLPVPGCSAAIAGLSVSGLPTDAFCFAGFLPKKSQKQQTFLENLKPRKETLIFFESPRRIQKLLHTIMDIMGNRNGCLAREITKLHEEYIRGRLSDIIQELDARQNIKGECSLFIQGNTQKKIWTDQQLEVLVREELSSDVSAGTAGLAKKIAKTHHLPKKRVYDLIIRLAGK